jgi:hypothetical protein
MEYPRFREPVFGQSLHTRPVQAGSLTAADQSFPPHLSNPKSEYPQTVGVPRNRVVVEIALHNRLEPLSGLHNRIVRAVAKLLLDFLKLGSHPFADRLALHHKGPVPFFPAYMREAVALRSNRGLPT